MLVAGTSFNCVAMPVFSNVKIENGRLTIQVEFKDRNFTRMEMMEHLHDAHLRILAKYNDFPYKFQGFEHKTTFDSFRIKYSELKSWREQTQEAVNNCFKVQCENGCGEYSSKTHVNSALLETLEKACVAMEYYKTHHAQEYSEARSRKGPMSENWRFQPA